MFVIDQSSLLPVNEGEITKVNSSPVEERFVIRNAEILFDLLADAVDEINEVFSKQVKEKFKNFLFFEI